MAEAVMQPAEGKTNALGGKSVLLKREWGWASIFVFALTSIGLTYSGLFPFSIVAGMYPGSNLIGVVTVGAVVSLVLAYGYAIIGSIVPHYGADYLLSSRVIHPALAFCSSVVVVAFLCIAGGTMVTSLAQDTLPMFAQILTTVTGDRAFVNYAESLLSSNGAVLVGTIGVVLIFLMLIFPPRVTRIVLTVGLALALIGWGVIAYQLGSVPAGSFQTSYDALMGQGAMMAHIESARNLGMELNTSTGSMISAGLLMGLWIFNGYFYPILFGSEVKRPQRTLFMGMGSSIVVMWAVLCLGAFLVMRQIPAEWLAAESYLDLSTSYHELAMPWMPFFGAVLRPVPALIWLVGLIWVYTIVNVSHVFLYTASRIVFAWAEDRLLPDAVTFVHPVLRSPVLAVLMVSLIALVGVVDTGLNGSAVVRFNSLFFMVVIQILPMLSLALLPILKRDWFASAPAAARVKIGPVPVAIIVGAFSLIYLVGMTILNYIYNVFGSVDLPSLMLFGVLVLGGLVWFYVRRYMIKAQGGDLDAWLKRLPEAEE